MNRNAVDSIKLGGDVVIQTCFIPKYRISTLYNSLTNSDYTEEPHKWPGINATYGNSTTGGHYRMYNSPK